VRLRERLILNMLIAMSLGNVVVYQGTQYYRLRQGDRILADALGAEMAGDGRAGCEARAATFGGGKLEPLPPLVGPEGASRPQVFAYDAAFHSANASAPPFPDDLRAALSSGERQAGGTFPAPSGHGLQRAVLMPWTDGPCAVLLGRFSGFSFHGSTRLFRLTVIFLVLIPTVLVTALPIVTRIRRLTAAVKTSADSTYTIKVPETRRDEIGELERAFNRAGEQVRTYMGTLEEREATLRSFVSNTVHDVAVPLTVVQGHLSTLQSLMSSDGRAQDGLRGAIRETHYLAGLLHNLGAAARFDRAAPLLERRPLDLNAIVSRVVARHGPLAATLGVELVDAVPELPLQVTADVTLLEQAASNLVHNAIHYNAPGGHVAVILERVNGGRRFSLRVIDDGPGIPAEERAHLTERTVRGSTGRAQRPEGQGLGLHIVREVVDRHGFGLHIRESTYGGAELEIEGPCSAEGVQLDDGLKT
jgi:two-component system sensor histidine kinase BaeS